MQPDDHEELAHVAAAQAGSDAFDHDQRWIEEARVAWDGDVPRVGIFFLEKRASLVAWLLGVVALAGAVTAGVYVLDHVTHAGEMTSTQRR